MDREYELTEFVHSIFQKNDASKRFTIDQLEILLFSIDSTLKVTDLYLSRLYFDLLISSKNIYIDLNSPNIEGNTLLHIASAEGKFEDVFAILTSSQLNINISPKCLKFEDTPLHIAVATQNLPIVCMLLQLGGEVNFRNKFEQSALHIAATLGNLEITQKLIDFGAATNLQDLGGDTPLHCAAASPNSNEDIIQELVKDCEPNIKNLQGETPLHLAASCGNFTVVKCLVEELGFHVEEMDQFEQTPLHFAAMGGHLIVSQYLFEKGAKLKVKNYIGKTPLDMALMCRKRDNLECSDTSENDVCVWLSAIGKDVMDIKI